MPLDRQLFTLSIGEAVAALMRQRHPRDTAKHIARAWNIDATTAANVVKGHVSERTLTKALRAEGWAFLSALGATITGETFEQYETRRLNHIIQEAESARKNLVSIASRREAMEARARELDALVGRPMADEVRGEPRSFGAGADGSRRSPANRKNREG